ncbi:junctional adhesion molecule B isoform X5 [Larus michahellis]|uniref:junctional adhesion molecule B isoform X5 n=1 Tax=Larus michahellis TaxID=119627 RepID=UPI003D9AC574
MMASGDEVAPTTPVCEVPSSAMTGTVVELSCKETEGSPPSEYQWYKNGVPLLEKTGTGSARAANITYTMNKKSGTLLFNTVTRNDTGEYYCEASNGIGLSQKCSVKRMQVDDLNVSGIIAAVVFVALVMALCGLGVFYAQKKGYFTSSNSMVLRLKSITAATLLCRHFYFANFYCKRYFINGMETFMQLHKATKQQSGESTEPNPGSWSLSALVLRRDGTERQHKNKPFKFTCSLKILSG